MDHERADREVWAAAERRAAVLVKLPERPTKAEVRTACAALGVSRATLFRWLKRYRETGRTSALLPRRRGPPQGMAPLAPEVLAVVERHFQDFYATRRRPTRTRLWRVKYDPRDLSRIFARVEDGYVEARPADVTRPAIALWEHRAAVAELRAAGRRAVDEDLIFSTILAQRALVDAAGAASKAARRQMARRAHLAPPAMIAPYFEVEEWDER